MDKATLIYDETNKKITLDRKDLKQYQSRVNALKKEINQLRLMSLKANREFFERYIDKRVTNIRCWEVKWNTPKNWVNIGFESKNKYFEVAMTKWSFKEFMRKAKENLIATEYCPSWIDVTGNNVRKDSTTITMKAHVSEDCFNKSFYFHLTDEQAKRMCERFKIIAKLRGW